MRINGGVMPGGICFKTVWDSDVTCAVAVRISTPEWKKIFTMPTPESDWLSIWSMSVTAVESWRS